jgi:hypothetical protein
LDRIDPLFVVADEKDNRYYDRSLQQGQNRKKSAGITHYSWDRMSGQHGTFWTGRSAKTVQEIIIGSQKLENDN